MANSIGSHWTRDDEQLDRYMKGGMSREERDRFDHHLRECPACADRLTDERAIRAGIRSFARSAAKDELGEMLSRRTARRQATYRWLAAAATLVLAVAIWYYPGDQAVPPTLGELQQSDTVVSVAPEAKTLGKMMEQKSIEEPRSGVTTRPSAGQPIEVQTGAGKEQMEMQDAMAGAAARADEAGAEMEEMVAPSAMPAYIPDDSWSIGYLEEKQLDVSGLRMESGRARSTTRRAQKKMEFAASEADRRKNVAISQEPFGQAPPAMQQQVVPSSGSMPVRMTRADDTTRIVLYPDRPWSDAEMSSAKVSDIDADTIYVQVGQQQIRFTREFRLPAKQ